MESPLLNTWLRLTNSEDEMTHDKYKAALDGIDWKFNDGSFTKAEKDTIRHALTIAAEHEALRRENEELQAKLDKAKVSIKFHSKGAGFIRLENEFGHLFDVTVQTEKLDNSKWQDINTAPKNARILLWSGQEKYCGHWSKNPDTDHEAWIVAEWGNDGDQALIENPTHWMPLPEAPEQR